MKNINELKQERAGKIALMSDIVNNVMKENRAKDEAETARWNALDGEVKGLDESIRMLERQEELNKMAGSPVEVAGTSKTVNARFMDAINEVRAGRVGSFTLSADEFRADPLVSTTIAQQNTQVGGVSIVKQDAKSFLQGLGTKVITGIKGQITLTSASAVVATFPDENTAPSSANFTPSTLTLSPRRVAVPQTYTKQFVQNVNDQIIADIITDLQDAIWRKLAEDLMTNVTIDAVDSSVRIAGSTLSTADIYSMEAAIEAAPMNPGFVTSPKVAAYLKGTATIANVSGPVWSGNPYNGSVDGIAAYGTPYAGGVTGKRLIYGDWNEAAVAQFGDVTVTINPYSLAKEGKIEIVVDTMADSGVVNKTAFRWINDVSIA